LKHSAYPRGFANNSLATSDKEGVSRYLVSFAWGGPSHIPASLLVLRDINTHKINNDLFIANNHVGLHLNA